MKPRNSPHGWPRAKAGTRVPCRYCGLIRRFAVDGALAGPRFLVGGKWVSLGREPRCEQASEVRWPGVLGPVVRGDL